MATQQTDIISIIYFVRHGKTASNQLGVYAEWSDEELTSEGVEEIKRLAEYFAHHNIYAIYTSPIRRAVQTAQILAETLRINAFTQENLREMKMGPWAGRSERDIAALYPQEYQLWNSKPAELLLQGRETLKRVQERAISAVKYIVNQAFDRKVIVVTHVALIRCLYLYFNGLDLNEYKKIPVPNASVFELQYDSNASNSKFIRIR